MRIDRRIRSAPKKPTGLWPPPDTPRLRVPAVAAASDGQLTRALRKLQATAAPPADRYKWLALEGEIFGEMIRRRAKKDPDAV